MSDGKRPLTQALGPRHLNTRPRHLNTRPRHLNTRPRHLNTRPRPGHKLFLLPLWHSCFPEPVCESYVLLLVDWEAECIHECQVSCVLFDSVCVLLAGWPGEGGKWVAHHLVTRQ